MPASLTSLKIRGIRSYSPYQHKIQSIEFMPLTLIVGCNGTGKTTIIEALKFLIAGEEPPLSDSRRNFIYTSNKPTNSFDKNVSYASIQLEFRNNKDVACVAKREINQAGSAKNATPQVSSAYKVGNQPWVYINKQDEWGKTIPSLFNLPNQALLNYVVLCHQEQNNWVMGDSGNVKAVFDKIFGCEQYKNEIKHINAEIKTCEQELKLSEKDLEHAREFIRQKKELESQVVELQIETRRVSEEAKRLDIEIAKIADQKATKQEELSKLKAVEVKTSEALKTTVKLLNQIKTDYSIDTMNVDDLSECFQTLRVLENELFQVKNDTNEKEDMAASRFQATVKSLAEHDGNCQGLMHKIRSKEKYIAQLAAQLAKADPIAKDLILIESDLSKMSLLTPQLPQNDLVKSLDDLIDHSKGLVGGLVTRVQADGTTSLMNDKTREETELEKVKTQLNHMDQERVDLVKKRDQAKEEHSKATMAYKEAHNKAAVFKNVRSEANRSYEKYIQEKKSLEEKGIQFQQVAQFDRSKLEKLTEEVAEITRQETELRNQRSMIAGSRLRMDRELSSVENNLRRHSKTNSKYAEKLGMVVCNKIVISDLQKLKDCFQHSVSTFHNHMISKINEVLKIKWRQIYQGTDIDYIELVDEEVTRGKSQVYNYYLAMNKGSLHMKMREKGSAGQRTLASIILKMTLAELFVKDFAFIALDEPTANLDLANVQSLAKAIGTYVKRRSSKGINIQWIIITHDDSFLKALSSECSPYYYRVSMDIEGCSRVSKLSYQEPAESSRENTQRIADY